MSEETTTPALQAYESLASIYDEFTHGNDHEAWIGRAVLPRLANYGLEAPGTALDVGCGTGKAFPPLLERGWDVCGCDISPAMVKIARERFGDRVRLSVVDMRRLPTIDSFDLVLALNDAVNHLSTDRDLDQAMTGFARNLSPGGLLVFDCNTMALYRELFDPAKRHVVERGDRSWVWQGTGEADRGSATFSARISGDSIVSTTITQRYFTRPEVERALEAAGLRCRGVYGLSEADGGIVFHEHPDGERDSKFIYIASLAGLGPSPSVNP